jgi:LuxR family transcriptional regulator, maltose regulon positive regulatory protein
LIQPILKKYHSIESITSSVYELTYLSIYLSRFYLACQDLDNAFLYFNTAHRYFSQFRKMFLSVPPEYTSLQIQLWLRQGEQERENGLLKEDLTFLNSNQRLTPAEHIALAKFYLSQNQDSAALKILHPLENILDTIGQGELSIEMFIVEAIGLYKIGEKQQALQSLQQAIRLAYPEGYIRIFIDEGELIKELLLDILRLNDQYGMVEESRTHLYVKNIITAFEQHPRQLISNDHDRNESEINVSPLQGPLSTRENEVLTLLRAGKSTKEIASILMVSINTVRTHLKHIYGKLDAHNRKDVLRRAVKMGLIDGQGERYNG